MNENGNLSICFVDRIVNPILSKYVGLCVCVGLMGRIFFVLFFFSFIFNLRSLALQLNGIAVQRALIEAQLKA